MNEDKLLKITFHFHKRINVFQKLSVFVFSFKPKMEK